LSTSNPFDLSGRKALVPAAPAASAPGDGSGRWARHGAAVVIADISAEVGKATATELSDTGRECRVRGNGRDQRGGLGGRDGAGDRDPRGLDILINNAGIELTGLDDRHRSGRCPPG